MKKALPWLLLILVILLIVAWGAFMFFNKSTTPGPTPATSSNTGFPVSGTTNSPSSTNTAANTISIPMTDGSTVKTTDFVHNGTTIEDPANAGTYYLAGSSGACKSDGTCPKAGTVTDFTILYYPSNGSFNIGLATEPLGPVRIEAEQYLMKELGLTQAQMCQLNYRIGTSTYVNQQYGGENLGFSFCPGAVALPQ